MGALGPTGASCNGTNPGGMDGRDVRGVEWVGDSRSVCLVAGLVFRGVPWIERRGGCR